MRTVALCLVLAGCDRGPAAAPTTLANSAWCFPERDGHQSSVTFLEGGAMKFSDYTSPGRWRQEGTKVVFDCNGFTEFRVELDGVRMRGEWSRLRGKDKGLTAPTRLEWCGS